MLFACFALATSEVKDNAVEVTHLIQVKNRDGLWDSESKEDMTNEEAEVVDWSSGDRAWKVALDKYDKSLWTKANYCDKRVLQSAAPLTVLYGLSHMWDQVRQQRNQSEKTASDPFELYVLGAAYPFEGRADWSLLANSRPADIPKLKVVLVLGSAWASDNVPVMHAKEYNEEQSLRQKAKGEPTTGEVVGMEISCDGSSLWQGDLSFQKSELCRDHGNGLEVVCHEEYYQNLDQPKPDAVAFFSPGFPQLTRRSWDEPLTQLLTQKVPILVSDLRMESTIQEVNAPVANFDDAHTEAWMTAKTMDAYDAQQVGKLLQSPFPIIIEKSREFVAKSALVQLYHGRSSMARPLTMPAESAIGERKALVNAAASELLEVWGEYDGVEAKNGMSLSTSSAYDEAQFQYYLPKLRELVLGQSGSKSEQFKRRLLELGLTGEARQEAWNVKDWLFVLSELHDQTWF